MLGKVEERVGIDRRHGGFFGDVRRGEATFEMLQLLPPMAAAVDLTASLAQTHDRISR